MRAPPYGPRDRCRRRVTDNTDFTACGRPTVVGVEFCEEHCREVTGILRERLRAHDEAGDVLKRRLCYLDGALQRSDHTEEEKRCVDASWTGRGLHELLEAATVLAKERVARERPKRKPYTARRVPHDPLPTWLVEGPGKVPIQFYNAQADADRHAAELNERAEQEEREGT